MATARPGPFQRRDGPSARRPGRPLRIAIIPLALLAAGIIGCAAQPPLEVLGQAPDFTLTDQAGVPFRTSDLAGRVALVDFVYTHCTDACPTLSATMSAAQNKLAAEKLLGSKAVLLSVTVDPAHDTPAALAEYGKQFGADAGAWKLLTGDWDQVYDVVAGFKVGTRAPRPAIGAPAPGGDEISHTTRVVLVDGERQIRAYLPGDEATPDDMVAAVKRVLR